MKFSCDIENLRKGIFTFKPLLSLTKRYTDLLLRVNEGEIQLCFNDGLHALVYRLDANTEGTGEYMIDCTKMMNIVSCCQPTQQLTTSPLYCEIDDRNTLHMHIMKYLKGQDDGLPLSTMSYALQLVSPHTQPKFAQFLQLDYNTLLQDCPSDQWDTEYFGHVVKTLRGTDKQTLMYFVAQEHKAKSRLLNMATVLDVPYLDAHSLVLTTGEALAICDCFTKLTKELLIRNDSNSHIYINDPLYQLGIRITMPEAQLVDKNAFELFNILKIQDITFKIHKGNFINVLRALRDVISADRYTLAIEVTEENIAHLVVTSTENTMSHMRVAITELNVKDTVALGTYKSLFNLETFLNTLTRCKAEWIACHLNCMENYMYEMIDVDSQTTDHLTAHYYGVLEKV